MNQKRRFLPGLAKGDVEGPKLLTKYAADHISPKSGNASKIPFFFIHINKTGGSSLITMLNDHCKEEYFREKWETNNGYNHRSFHSTAHSYIERHGRAVWDEAYSFAVVRHPLARQVSNFFFLLSRK